MRQLASKPSRLTRGKTYPGRYKKGANAPAVHGRKDPIMTNELMNRDQENTNLMTPAQGQASYCSFTAGTTKEKAMLFNGMNNPDAKLSDEVNQVIAVKEIYAEMVDLADEETGEITTVPRVVLFDAEGKSHQAMSIGIFKAVKKLLDVFGEPSQWEEPIKVKIKNQSIKERKMLTFEVQA